MKKLIKFHSSRMATTSTDRVHDASVDVVNKKHIMLFYLEYLFENSTEWK